MSEEEQEGKRAFPKKWLKKIQESGWQDMADSMETDELKKRIVEFEQAIGEHEALMEKDSFLEKLKEDLSERKGVYTVPIAEITAKIKYSVYVLESRGTKVKG